MESHPDGRDSSSVDVTPTVLHILGVKSSTPMDGRVLSEALVDGGPAPTVDTQTMEASRDSGIFHWKQYLKYSRVGQAIYFDEGNGEPAWK